MPRREKSEENMSFGGKGNTIFMVFVCVLGVFCAECGGAVVEVQIWGWVTAVEDSSGLLDSPIAIDDAITGFYRYDTDTQDSSQGSDLGDYRYTGVSPFGMTLNIGQSIFESNRQDENFLIEVRDNYYQKDGYLITSSNNLPLSNGTEVSQILWQIEYDTLAVIESDALSVAAPVLGTGQTNNLRITCGRSSIRGTIEFAEAQVVPEPASALLMLLGAVIAISRRRN